MGMSVSVLKVTDDQIRAFQDDPARAMALVNRVVPYASEDECYLADFWHGVHFLLAQQVEAVAPPLGAVLQGDVTYQGGAEPLHAIYSATTKALADEMAGLTEAALHRRYDPPRMQKVYPVRYWLTNERLDAEQSFPELYGYFRKLAKTAVAAARDGKGLLFCRYEDW